MTRLTLALLCLAACGRDTGTFVVDVAAAPGGDLLARVEVLRATLSDPHEVVEASRDADGLSLALEVDADGGSGELVLEGFDAAGVRIAVGESGPLPIAALDGRLTIYLAPPMSFAEAPVGLATPRSDLGAARFGFGALLAGGAGPGGEPVDDVEIYDVYGHELLVVESMPSPLAAPSVAGSVRGTSAVLFGGEDEGGEPVADAYLFSAAVAPSGGYLAIPASDEHARAGASIASSGAGLFIAGSPALLLDPDRRVVTPVEGGAAAGSVAVSVWPDVLVVGDGIAPDGAALLRDGSVAGISSPGDARRLGHAGVTLGDADALVVGGAVDGELVDSALLYRQESGDLTLVQAFLATPRLDPAVAATADHIVVAGGTDAGGAPIGDAEIFDAVTLERVATIPLVVPRAGAAAIELGNGQVLLAGGTDADGEPTAVLELFTPDVAPE